MKLPFILFHFTLFLLAPLVHCQENSVHSQPTIVDTTVCKILDNPVPFNNKLVRIRGELSVNFEYSMLKEEGCSDAIWFALGDGSGPPGLAAIVSGKGRPGGHNAKKESIRPIPIRLVRDSNFEKFEKYIRIKADKRPCVNYPLEPTLPDCGVDRVIATFTGRIDSVSKEVRAAHLKRRSNDGPDFKGFGQMGLFDAQIVVQLVEEVVALDSFGREKP